jgi:hypothetical protein
LVASVAFSSVAFSSVAFATWWHGGILDVLHKLLGGEHSIAVVASDARGALVRVQVRVEHSDTFQSAFQSASSAQLVFRATSCCVWRFRR